MDTGFGSFGRFRFTSPWLDSGGPCRNDGHGPLGVRPKMRVAQASESGLAIQHFRGTRGTLSRPLRIELAGGLYHVTSRGNRREAIYRDAQDRLEWLAVLGEVAAVSTGAATPMVQSADP